MLSTCSFSNAGVQSEEAKPKDFMISLWCSGYSMIAKAAAAPNAIKPIRGRTEALLLSALDEVAASFTVASSGSPLIRASLNRSAELTTGFMLYREPPVALLDRPLVIGAVFAAVNCSILVPSVNAWLNPVISARRLAFCESRLMLIIKIFHTRAKNIGISKENQAQAEC